MEQQSPEGAPFDLKGVVSRVMEVTYSGTDGRFLTFRGRLLVSAEEAMAMLRSRLENQNYLPFLRREKAETVLRIGKVARTSKEPKQWVNLVLFLATVLTTLFAGTVQRGVNPIQEPWKLYLGVPFSLSLLLILGAHELGHFFTCRRLGVKATLPYFIPFPHLVGTFGAVIRMRSPIPDKKALVKVGAAGPLAGLVFAIPITAIGLELSTIVDVSSLEGSIPLGNSLLFHALSRIVFSDLAEGQDVLLHPVAFAGWFSMFVTAMNLLPIGQLDGGHISYAIFGKAQSKVAWMVFAALIGLGLLWPVWFVFAFLVFFLGLRHPPPLNDVTPLDRRHLLLGAGCFLCLVLTFMPVPMRLMLR